MTLFLDLDGPILDVSQRYYRVHRLCVGVKSPPRLSPEEFWEMKRERAQLGEILAREGVSPAQAPDYSARWRQWIEEPDHLLLDKPFPGVLALLADWRQRHHLILVTLRQRPDTLRVQLDRLAVAPLFHQVLVGSPGHPEGEHVKEQLMRTSPHLVPDSIIVGDTEIDIRAGKNAGLRTAAVLCGIRSRRCLEAELPDHLLPRLADLPSVVSL